MTVQLDPPSVKPGQPAARKTYTIEQFEALSLPGDYRYELIKGELHRMGATGDRHGRLTGRFFKLIDNYLDQEPVGVVWVTTGFILDDSNPQKPTVRIPDVGFVLASRVLPLTGKVVPIAPDLAIEIVSPSDKWADVIDKVAEYLEHGVQLVWVVPPGSQLVEVYRQGATKPEILGPDDELDGGEVVKGFKLRVSKLFEFTQTPSSV